MPKKVAVIGAGASGITAIKCCLDEGLVPVCFERTGEMGGLWYYTDEVRENQACVMKSTVINTSKEMMCYSDFPIPKEYPNYMHHSKVLEYFHEYLKTFDLDKHIRYHTSVRSVKQNDDFNETGKWKLEIEAEGKVTTEIYDAVLVCTGHHAFKNVPTFKGLDEFKGEVLHSHDYKHQSGYEDKRVVVVGIGNSGGDAAVELSRVAQVFLSTRRGSWVFNRIFDNGLPADLIGTRRVAMLITNLFPRKMLNRMVEAKLNKRFDHEMYSLKPSHGVFSQHPMVNDDLPNRIACGSIVIKPDIKCFTKSGVEFDDGSFEDNIDLVLLATGYKFGFPFIDKSVIDVKNNVVNLYKNMFPPNLSQPTMAIIGCFQPIGAVMPISELQCRWASRVFKDLEKLPSAAVMNADIIFKRNAMAEQYIQTQRHTIQVDWIPFMDEISRQFGAKPDLWKLLREDPKLALACFFGPCTPYQYRLTGPGSWEGAREAILTQWERVFFPLRTRKVPNEEKGNTMMIIYSVLIILFIAWFFCWLF